jgi:hypothetical protein
MSVVVDLSKAQQDALLAKRVPGHLIGDFDAYCSVLYTLDFTAIHTENDEINETRLDACFPDFYKPTHAELFEAIARQTKSTWSYDSKRGFWVFAKPAQKLPYTIALAEKWKADDRGEYVCYQPPSAPVGMDIYMLGTYSAEKVSDERALYDRVRESIALRFAKRIN